jgi:hypothetical protein
MGNDVNVVVGANNSPLNAGLAAAKKSVDSFKEHTEESFKELGGELAGAFAVGAIVEGMHSLIEQFSHIQDISEKLGTSAESLQRMGAAAKLAGLDMEGLVKAMQKGTRNAVEALKGNEELAGAFEDLGIDAKEFANAAPEEQLIKLAEGYEKSGQNAETLDAIMKTLGKSGADIIPLLRKGPEALREELDSASVASNETVANLKEAGDTMEKVWMKVKAAAATSLNWMIEHVKALGTGIAAIVAYVSNLTNGFEAASEAMDKVYDDAAELQFEEKQQKEAEAKNKKPVDTDALDGLKEAKKQAEELQKLKDENAKKEHEAYMRSLDLLERKAELEREILNIQLQNENAKDDTERETNKGKILDIKKELESANKDIERENERHAKEQFEKNKKATEQNLRETIAAKKKALSDSEKDLNSLEKAEHKTTSVDDLRKIGGGVAGANYHIGASKDDLIKQQVEHAKQSVEIQQKILAALEKQEQQVQSYDGGFN